MDVYEAIEKRRSIPSFKTGATEEQLRRIVLAGSRAPSGGNYQPWEFIIVDDPAIVGQLGELKYRLDKGLKPDDNKTPKDVEEHALSQKRGFAHASVVAVCASLGEFSAGWLAVENMSLAAVAEGLGSAIAYYWGDGKSMAEKLLGLPSGYHLTCVLKIGVPEGEVAPPVRRPDFSWLHRNTF